jgi:lipopolysaccharide/colanic/teichoic acid biosynthesis glycosyltransferase
MSENMAGMSLQHRVIKRAFDLFLSALALTVFWWVILLAWFVATLDTGRNGFFTQVRVGRYGKPFRVIKIRTMRDGSGLTTTVTASGDPRITPLGRIFRITKIDELPQILNVLVGQMSFVGPRPDVPGFADLLNAEDKIILSIRPGITGPATLKYKNEEELLVEQNDPEAFNREVIFPDKVRINKEYIETYAFSKDLYYVWKTILG